EHRVRNAGVVGSSPTPSTKSPFLRRERQCGLVDTKPVLLFSHQTNLAGIDLYPRPLHAFSVNLHTDCRAAEHNRDIMRVPVVPGEHADASDPRQALGRLTPGAESEREGFA